MHQKQKNTFIKIEEKEDNEGSVARREVNLSQDQILKMREIIKEDAARRQTGIRDSSTSVIKHRK